MKDNKDLKELREEIDEIDQRIVELYEHRMRCSEEVAAVKLKQGMNVLDKKREMEKIAAAEALTHSEFTRHGVRELFDQIMTMSRMRQYQLLTKSGQKEEPPFTEVETLFRDDIRVVYQGTEGAYAQMALHAFFGKDRNTYNVYSWRDAMREIASGRADYAVLPFENSSAGIVSENYDLLVEYDATIVGEEILPVEHCLLALPEAKFSDITTVCSHAQALMQCSRFLDKNRQIERLGMANTALAAKKVKEDGNIHQAAIASELTAELYGLQFLYHGIQNSKSNSTRFLIVSHKKIFVSDAKKITLCFELPDRGSVVSGSLYHELSHFIFNGLNMNHIESRPIPERNWEYRFFIDLDGNLKDPAVINALKGLSEETRNLKILGNY
ncbi:MAG: chorismate mutase [Lachnospiraceae bacterium]|nr:chorismate mutase [Lachnospiraceae bacterium]